MLEWGIWGEILDRVTSGDIIERSYSGKDLKQMRELSRKIFLVKRYSSQRNRSRKVLWEEYALLFPIKYQARFIEKYSF